MKIWAIIAVMSFVATGIAGQDEANFVSAMFALLFLISLVVMFFKWLVGVAKKHPEWMSDDDEYVPTAAKKTNTKTPKTTPKKAKPAPITKTKQDVKGYPAEQIAENVQVKPLDSEYDNDGEPLFIVKPPVDIKICYNGMMGGKTTRTVTVQALRNGRSVYIIGWCHMYNDQREFYAPAIDKIWVKGKETTTVEFIRSLGFDKKIGRLNDFPPQMVPESEKPVKRVLNKTKNTNRKRKQNPLSPFLHLQEISGAGRNFIFDDIRFDIKPDREIEIEYQDSAGDRTKRRVTAQVLQSSTNSLVLIGYCHLRNRERSFKLTGIRKLYENGREIKLIDWLYEIGFANYRPVQERIARQKLAQMVDKMDDGALDDFIKNSTAAGV